MVLRKFKTQSIPRSAPEENYEAFCRCDLSSSQTKTKQNKTNIYLLAIFLCGNKNDNPSFLIRKNGRRMAISVTISLAHDAPPSCNYPRLIIPDVSFSILIRHNEKTRSRGSAARGMYLPVVGPQLPVDCRNVISLSVVGKKILVLFWFLTFNRHKKYCRICTLLLHL